MIAVAVAFPPTPFANGVLANLTAGGPGSSFCSWTLDTGASINDGSHLCLTAFDAEFNRPVYLSRCNGSGSQLWAWVGAEMDGGLMYIGPNARGQECVTGVDPLRGPPSPLTLAPCAFAPWQQLTSDSDGNGTLALESLPNGRAPLFVCSPQPAAPSDAPAAPSDAPAVPSDAPAAPSDAPAAPSPDAPAAPSPDAPAAPPPRRLPNSPFPVSSPPPATGVWVINVTGMALDSLVLFQSLAGVVAQDAPQVYLFDGADLGGGGPTGRGGGGPTGGSSLFQLSLLPPLLPRHWALANDPAGFLARFAGGLGGYILCDTPPPSAADNGSMHVAISLAGILRGVVVTAATLPWALAAGLCLALDARALPLGRAFSDYSANFSKTILLNQQVRNLGYTVDYAVFARAFAFYDAELTLPTAAAALARLEPVSMVLGWGQELDTVTAASRYGHAVLCSDSTRNLPLFSNVGAPPAPAPAPALPRAACTADPAKHTVAFMFTDGDSLTWDLGQFASPEADWWGSPVRGSVPVAWTFNPLLAELHPLYLAHVLASASGRDALLAGPSGAGYAYLDQFPSGDARREYAQFASAALAGVPAMLNMVNQIQVGAYDPAVEAEIVATRVEALFIDEYTTLTLKGSSRMLNDTLITSRRHCLATWGDVTPASLLPLLNAGSTDSASEDGYSLIGVEVWSYGLTTVLDVSRAVDPARVQVVPLGEYVSCVKERVFGRAAMPAVTTPPTSTAKPWAVGGVPSRGPEEAAPPPLPRPRDALAAAAAPPSSLLFYNATYAYALDAAAGYEEVTLLAALAGIVNRGAPTLLLNLEAPDAEWLARTAAPGGWLAGTTLVPIAPPIENLLVALAAVPAGVVLFHPDIPCTSAIANTVAGAEDLLPVALREGDPTSLYSRLVVGGLRLPVRRTLPRFTGNASGSVKRDAYTWAVDTYLSTGLSSPLHLGYYVDYYWAIFNRTEGGVGFEKATVPNLDYVVAQRGFFFDLSVWGDEAPVDEPRQPLGSDLAALRYILDAAAAAAGGRAITVAHGFTPWAYKYVAPWGKHGGVEAEWATCRLFSAFNVLDDGDACCIGGMANAALWRLFPLADRYVQAGPPSRAALQARGLLDAGGAVVGHRLYYMFYAGDYDSAAWLYSQLLERWEDPARGSVPIGWAVDPGLAARFPVIYPHLFSTLSPLDNIITGDSGAGYLNPTMLYGDARAGVSGLPDGWAPWAALNTALNRQFNVRFTGFVIAGDAPLPGPADDARFANFSALGVVNQGWPSLFPYLNGNMPVLTQWDLPTNASDAARVVQHFTNASQAAPKFQQFRSILTSPTFLKAVADGAAAATGGAAVAITPLEISMLMRVYFNGTNSNMATYVGDTLPAAAPGGALVTFNATVRNDGWNVLPAGGVGLLVAAVEAQDLVRPPLARGRGGWARAALLDLDAGASAAQGARRALARAGFAGREPRPLRPLAVFFPLPEDLPPGDTATVAAEVQLPQRPRGGGAEGTLVDVEYQLAYADGRTFDAFGNIPWRATLLVE